MAFGNTACMCTFACVCLWCLCSHAQIGLHSMAWPAFRHRFGWLQSWLGTVPPSRLCRRAMKRKMNQDDSQGAPRRPVALPKPLVALSCARPKHAPKQHAARGSAETRPALPPKQATVPDQLAVQPAPAPDVWGSVPRSMPAAVAWLRQHGPTDEAQLAALNVRLQDTDDAHPWRLARDARLWATALGRPLPRLLAGQERDHDAVRNHVLELARHVLQQDWSRPGLAHMLARGLVQLQEEARRVSELLPVSGNGSSGRSH